MDQNQQHMQTPVAGDDELAKALDNNDDQAMKFEESPMPSMITDDSASNEPSQPAPTMAPASNDDKTDEQSAKPPENHNKHRKPGGDLERIKEEVIKEMKPLVRSGKLDLPADEKFDTLLMMIRTTDDQSLLQATFEAAKAITDESKRAKALLDVMREVSYFSDKNNQ